MQHEVVKDRTMLDSWRVEAINFQGDGEVYVAIFSGPDAEKRARDYADWQNGVRELARAS
jgi:hypothetical protein